MTLDVYRDVKQHNNNNLSQIVKQTRWKTLAFFQNLSHVYGSYIADAFIKYRVGRYTHRQKRYKYYISVTKSGVLMELFDLECRLFWGGFLNKNLDTGYFFICSACDV